MADYLEHSERWRHHPQPDRVPDTHWSADGDYLHPGTDPAACGSCKAHEPATGVNAGPPSDRDGADDAPDEAEGLTTPAPVAVHPRVDQTIFVTDPKRKGNCVAACVATILGIPLAQVPHFIEFGIAYGDSEDVKTVSSGNNWWAMMLGFLAGRGLWVVELDKVTDADPDEFVLVAGMSPRGVVHQVVYREGRLWHDPHPSRDGVLDVREVLAVRPLPGFDHEPTRPLTPADPHDHDWADLGTPGLHGSVCRACGETQID